MAACTLHHEPIPFCSKLVKNKQKTAAPQVTKIPKKKKKDFHCMNMDRITKRSLQRKTLAHHLCFHACVHLCLASPLKQATQLTSFSTCPSFSVSCKRNACISRCKDSTPFSFTVPCIWPPARHTCTHSQHKHKVTANTVAINTVTRNRHSLHSHYKLSLVTTNTVTTITTNTVTTDSHYK